MQASCSSRVSEHDFVHAVESAARDSGVGLAGAVCMGHAIDHPVGFPEGAYLNAVFATVERAR